MEYDLDTEEGQFIWLLEEGPMSRDGILASPISDDRTEEMITFLDKMVSEKKVLPVTVEYEFNGKSVVDTVYFSPKVQRITLGYLTVERDVLLSQGDKVTN